MLTFGFYNAINHDRTYDAEQMSSIFDGIIEDGVFMSIGEHLNVTAGENMRVIVAPGRAWFNHTWSLNDAPLPIDVEESEVVLDRIDALVLEINHDDMVRANEIKFVKGLPSSEPEKPELIHNEVIHQYPLAYVTVKAGVTQIRQDDIENAIGTSETPFITGILDTINIDTLIAQWESQFNTQMTEDKSRFDKWYTEARKEYVENFDSDQEAFETWFANLQVQLDANVAANLQRQIDDISGISISEIDEILVTS